MLLFRQNVRECTLEWQLKWFWFSKITMIISTLVDYQLLIFLPWSFDSWVIELWIHPNQYEKNRGPQWQPEFSQKWYYLTLPCLSLIWISKSYQCIVISHWSRGLTNERNETVVLNRCFPFSHWSRRKWLLNCMATRREIGVSSFFGMSYVRMTLTLRGRQKSSSLILHLTFRDKGSEVYKILTPSLFPARQVTQPTCYCSLPQASKWGGKHVYPLPTVV